MNVVQIWPRRVTPGGAIHAVLASVTDEPGATALCGRVARFSVKAGASGRHCRACVAAASDVTDTYVTIAERHWPDL